MRKILAIFMLFAGLNLAAGEKMQNLKIILKSSNGEATAILDDTAAARSFAAQLPLTPNLEDYGGHEKGAKLPKPRSKRQRRQIGRDILLCSVEQLCHLLRLPALL